MRRSHTVSVMHVPDTGHTPVLSDRNQNWFIHEWLMDSTLGREWTVLHARLRDEAAVGGPFARRRHQGRLRYEPSFAEACGGERPSRSRSRWRSTSIMTLKVRASRPISSSERTTMLALS